MAIGFALIRRTLQAQPSEPMTTSPITSIPVEKNHFVVRGVSPTMQALERIVADIAPTDIPILLVGEGGTGKEVLALRIHQLSHRRNQGLFKIRCGSLNGGPLPAHLFETGGNPAGSSGSGPGTVVFDEISELDPAGQRTLICALPEGNGLPGTRSLKARVISATSRSLEEEIRAGRFRSELYYRVNGVCLRLPPLRERKEDIPALSDFFLTKYAAQFNRPRLSLSQETLNLLLEHSWPGNIRELENVMKKIAVLGDERIAVVDTLTAPTKSRPVFSESVGTSLKAVARAASRQVEQALILNVLEQTHWNRKRAAQQLQISYKSLLQKLKEIGRQGSETT